MNRCTLALTLMLPVLFVAWPETTPAAAPGDAFELTVQRRDDTDRLIHEPRSIDPARTVIVVVDMWDKHWCKTFTRRVANLVPRMNLTLLAARKLGIPIVFAPSDVLQPYHDTPQRRAMLAVEQQPLPPHKPIDAPPNPGPTDQCECGPGAKPKRFKAWTAQHADLVIGPDDFIADCNNGRELLNLCQSRNVDTVVYMGVASNMCVQYRGMGMRNMLGYGLQALLVSDLTQAITANGLGADLKPDPNFTPAKGTAQVQRHIERYLAPTFESRQLIRQAGIGPYADDRRPHIALVVAEREYDTHNTLPRFARAYLDEKYRCSFCFPQGHDGAERNDVRGLEVLLDADLLVLSMRRRALPVEQMDHLEWFIRAGKPLVAIRTSVTPFQVREAIPDGHVTWDRFDRQVLGCNYNFYDSRSRETGCDVWAAPEAAAHPIVAAMPTTSFHSPSWIYRVRPLDDRTTPLLLGRFSPQAEVEPVAWTSTFNSGRVFCTTLGHAGDFEIEAFNRLLIAGIDWALDRPPTKR